MARHERRQMPHCLHRRTACDERTRTHTQTTTFYAPDSEYFFALKSGQSLSAAAAAEGEVEKAEAEA